MANDAIAFLKDQHDQAKKHLEALAATTDRGVKTRKELLAKIEEELVKHMVIEEEIFYPAFKEAATKKEDEKLYHEAQEEHRAAKRVLTDLLKSDPSSVAFGGKAKVLKELVEHHVEEEESEMFPRARQIFSKADLTQLEERMQARFSNLDEAALETAVSAVDAE
jgi:hemerythrin-like domain-containing protein